MSIVQKVAVGAVVVAVAWGGATLYIGTQAEKQYNAMLDKIEQEFPMLTLKDRQFERSFLSSRATLTLQADFSELLGTPAGSNDALTLETHIQHGPLTPQGLYLATFRTQPVFTPEQRSNLRAVFGEQEPITAHGQWRFSGVAHGHFALAPFSVGEAKEGIRAGSLAIDFAAQNGKLLWHTGSLPSLNVTSTGTPSAPEAKFQAEVGPISWHANNHYNGALVGDLAPSEAEIQVDSLTMRREDGNFTLELGKMAVQATLALKDDFADIKETFTLHSLTFRPDNAVEQARTLGPFTVQVDLNHLAAEPLDELIKSIDQLNTAGMDDKQKMELMLAAIAPHLIEIFTAGPSFSFDPMRLSTPKGDMNLSLRIAAPGLAQQDLINPAGAFNKLQVSIEGVAPKAALAHTNSVLTERSEEESARELEAWLADVRDENLFTVDGDTLRFSFRIQDGGITLNNQSFSMAELIAKTQSAQSAMENNPLDEDVDEEGNGITLTPPEGAPVPSPESTPAQEAAPEPEPAPAAQ
ncbi:MAG: DUF945 family protein [Rhodocyclaceae bacterium]|nr:DUF945 family protein [Rhodocyclaceae bacterium]